jgi:hypothetical protein
VLSKIIGRLQAVPSLLVCLGSYLRYRCINFLSRNKANRPVAVVHFEEFPDIPDRRYFYLFLRTLIGSGYYVNVVRQTSFRRFLHLRRYEKLALQLDNLRTTPSYPHARGSELLFTNVISRLSENGWKKIVEIDCDIVNGSRSTSDIFMPYFMHPVQYQLEMLDHLAELRRAVRRVRIFFSGNISEENYVNRLPGNKLTRAEICEALQGTSGVLRLTDEKQFVETFFPNQFTNDCVLNDRLVYAVPDEDWLRTLALCDFFLCLPGSRMPLCHNAVEAMAVGAIPILNYSEWFEPALEDGKNCIEFGTVEELRHRIAEIRNYDAQAIERMRQNVIEYYEANLTPSAFRKRLERTPGLKVRVLVNTEFQWETEFAEPPKHFAKSLAFEHLT